LRKYLDVKLYSRHYTSSLFKVGATAEILLACKFAKSKGLIPVWDWELPAGAEVFNEIQAVLQTELVETAPKTMLLTHALELISIESPSRNNNPEIDRFISELYFLLSVDIFMTYTESEKNYYVMRRYLNPIFLDSFITNLGKKNLATKKQLDEIRLLAGEVYRRHEEITKKLVVAGVINTSLKYLFFSSAV